MQVNKILFSNSYSAKANAHSFSGVANITSKTLSDVDVKRLAGALTEIEAIKSKIFSMEFCNDLIRRGSLRQETLTSLSAIENAIKTISSKNNF